MKDNKTVINAFIKDNLNIKNSVMLLGFALIILGAVNSTIGNVAGGASCFVVAVILITLFFFEVKSFKVLGMAAELGKKINEADEVLEKLRRISLPISEIAVTTASQAGRYDTAVPRKKLSDFVSSISNELRDMGVAQESIERVKDSWYLATSIDMALPIHREIQNQIDVHHSRACKKLDDINRGVVVLSEEDGKLFDEELGRIEWDRHHYYTDEMSCLNQDYQSYPSYFRRLINELTGIPEVVRDEMLIKINEHILDLEYLIKQKQIRRPELWFK
ncbi:MAG: hypothetical protein WCC49_16800 [Pantoea agglomerans]